MSLSFDNEAAFEQFIISVFGGNATNFPVPIIGGAASRTHTANSLYVARFAIPFGAKLTGIVIQNAATLNGSVIPSLYDVNGNLLAASAGTAQSGTASQPQLYPFSAPITVMPGIFYAAMQYSSATGTSFDGFCYGPSAVIAQGAFAAPASITPPTTPQFGTNMPTMITY